MLWGCGTSSRASELLIALSGEVLEHREVLPELDLVLVLERSGQVRLSRAVMMLLTEKGYMRE